MTNNTHSFTIKTVLVTLLMMLSIGAAAQNKPLKVKGNVYDENGLALPGVAVMVDGTTTGTMTGDDGSFTISANKGATLIFSIIGYKELKLYAKDTNPMRISLEPDTNYLDEAVVVGYGTMKRSDITGSVASVSAKAIENFKTSSVVDALGGQIAGVNIVSSDGTPGGSFDIKIRGLSTVTGDSSPLYIVDGFEVSDINFLANQDIKSVEVLKDASASAIYGSRAANGVVLVTTKSGRDGRVEVSYNGSATYRMLSKKLDVLNPYDFVKLQVEVNPARYGERYYKSGTDSKGQPYMYQSLEDYQGVAGVDWQDEAFRPTWGQNHDVSLLGGDKNTQYIASFSHFDEDGMFEGSGYSKNNARVKFTRNVFKWMTFDANVVYAEWTKTGVGTGGSTLSNILGYRPTGGLYTSDYELRYNSYDPIMEQTGVSNTNYYNPILNAAHVDAKTKRENWIGNAALTFRLGKYVNFKTSGSYNTYYQRQDTFYQAGSSQADRGEGPYGGSTTTRSKRWTWNNVVTWYIKLPKKHTGNLVAGHETTYSSVDYVKSMTSDFPEQNMGVNNLGLGAKPTEVSSSFTDKRRLSFFARGTYNYDKRYYLTATFRADASTVFSDNNKWGFFPSFAAAWSINNEKWLKNVRWITNMKLRAGWGMVGNDNISSYLSMDLYNNSNYGLGGKQVTALYPAQIANQNLKWEAQATANVGLDLGFFKDRLNITVDGFIKDSKDLLLSQSLALNTGFSAQMQNIGQVRNKGIELSINSINFNRKKFSWTTDFNISFIKNTLVSLMDGDDHLYSRSGFNSNFASYDYVAVVGSAIGNMYGYQFDGIYQYSDFNMAPDGTMTLKDGVTDISQHAGTPARPGFVKYKDIDGDGIITDKDRTIIGNGQPDFYGGITNTFNFYGFDFSFMFQFSVGADIYNAQRMWTTQTKLEMMNSLGEVRDRWTAQNASNLVPSTDGYVSYDVYSRFIEDGSFLRLKNVTLGYTIPDRITRKAFISKLRFYLTAQNVYCFTNYSGYDPEVSTLSSNLMPGFDYGAYPKNIALTFGIDLKF